MTQLNEMDMELLLVMRSILNFRAPVQDGAEVIQTVCEILGVNTMDVTSHSRKRELFEARAIIAGIIYADRPSPAYIAELLGGMHRTTVYYQLSQYETFIEGRDKTFLAKLAAVQREFPWINLLTLPQQWKKN